MRLVDKTSFVEFEREFSAVLSNADSWERRFYATSNVIEVWRRTKNGADWLSVNEFVSYARYCELRDADELNGAYVNIARLFTENDALIFNNTDVFFTLDDALTLDN